MDDIIIKSRSLEKHMENLKEIFIVLNEGQMKINPSKCAFFIMGEKFLGYIVSAQGIDPNPEKV